MYILGINESHTSTAALLKDGQILACASEERFTRVKGMGGFPKHAIEFCLKYKGIEIFDIDLVVLGFERDTDIAHLQPHIGQNHKIGIFWKTKYLIESITIFIYGFFPQAVLIYDFFAEIFYKISKPFATRNHRLILSRKLGLPKEKIALLDHHTAHAWAANYIFGGGVHKRLVITNDGMGDDACGKVFTVVKDSWQQIASTPNRYSLGLIYYYVTQYLGFTPNQDEYKLMGLAPYSQKQGFNQAYLKLKDLIWGEGLSFKSRIPCIGYFNYLQRTLAKMRFDEIAAAMQKLTEELTVEQIKQAIKITGIKEVMLGGGLAMNIKANMSISQIPRIKNLLVCPSPSDESTAIGACFWGYYKLCQGKENN